MSYKNVTRSSPKSQSCDKPLIADDIVRQHCLRKMHFVFIHHHVLYWIFP